MKEKINDNKVEEKVVRLLNLGRLDRDKAIIERESECGRSGLEEEQQWTLTLQQKQRTLW